MLYSNININNDFGTAASFFNPFGPNFLYYKLQPDVLKKALDCIIAYRSDRKYIEELKTTGQIVQGTRSKESQENSIVSGEMLPIDQEFQTKHFDNVIQDIINISSYNYGLQSAKFSVFDMGMRDMQDEYVKEIDEDISSLKVSIKDCWFVVLKEGDFHILHEHHYGGAILSGAIYLDVPKKPWPQGNINWIANGPSVHMFNSSWGLQPTSGDVFVWPSWLKHTVYPFKGEGERIMISFNTTLLSARDKKNDK